MTHVQTWQDLASGDGNRLLSWSQAAPYLTYALTKVSDSLAMHQAGLKTSYYTNPNREGPGDPMYSNDESTFAHDCSGNRILSLGIDPNRYLMDPHSTDLGGMWQAYSQQIQQSGGWIDYIFQDKADDISKATAQPCNWAQSDWTNASNQLDNFLTSTMLYNSLSHTSVYNNQPQVSPSIALNATSAGGMSEDCYVQTVNTLRYSLPWEATELTEIDMAQQGKMFICDGSMTLDAASSIPQRMYLIASFLLTYDPSTSVLQSNFTTYSGLRVYPEDQLVAKQPLIGEPSDPTQLIQSGGAFGRQYKACYLAGNYVGPCAAVVNSNKPNTPPIPFPWSNVYHHTLFVTGAGVIDGGNADPNGPAPPSTMAPGTGIIAFP